MMAAVTAPLAHVGHFVQTLPFFVPALALPLVLLAIGVRDRKRERSERRGA